MACSSSGTTEVAILLHCSLLWVLIPNNNRCGLLSIEVQGQQQLGATNMMIAEFFPSVPSTPIEPPFINLDSIFPWHNHSEAF